jgi:Predicted hydrolases of the HAD superfamily
MSKRNRVIAVDFDGTLCDDAWPEIGKPNKDVIYWIKEQQASGAKLILWTCRTDKLLDAAVEWSKEQGITFDAVNENLPELIEMYGNDCRKVSADIYIDDKVVNPLAHRQMAGLASMDIYKNKIDAQRK